jgi:hypothetical protein
VRINPATGLPVMREFFVDKGMTWDDYEDFLSVDQYGRWECLIRLTDYQLAHAISEADEWCDRARTRKWAQGDKKDGERYTLAVALHIALKNEWMKRGLHRMPNQYDRGYIS